jgi:hypothetical protein
MANKSVKISIVSPGPDQIFLLNTAPVETNPIIFRAVVTQDSAEITGNVKVSWKLRLSWQATHKVYQTKIEIAGNSAEVKFASGGILRIRAAVIVDGREYSARSRGNIIGANPTKDQLNKVLDSDLIKALAWQESTWRQFNNDGKPLMPVVPKGQKKPSMRGLFQISEWWWAEERTPLPLKDFNRMAWQWDYNLQAAKLILEHYHNRVLMIFPKESAQKQWDWTLKTYKLGPGAFESKEDPGKNWYVLKIKDFIKSKPWQE